MTEATHDQLKLMAKQLLLKRGFAETQIFEEVPVLTSSSLLRKSGLGCPFDLISRKGIIADVVGVKDNLSVVIECGLTPLDRLVWLKLFFDEVLYLPFVTTVDKLDEPLRLQSQIDHLKDEKEQLEETIENQHRLILEMKAKLKQILDNANSQTG